MELYKKTGSTNDICLELCRQQLPEGYVVIADEQTGGRGRLGRRWISPPGQNIYLSILLRPDMQPNVASIITLMASIGCINAMKKLVPGIDAHIKWPNDLMIGAKKTGGILTESRIEGMKLSCAVVGIGLNVNIPGSELPRDTIIPATSIFAETGITLNRSELAAAMLQETDDCYTLLKAHGIKAVIETWLLHTRMIGRHITVSSAEGETSGIAEGLDEEGRLIVRQQDNALKTILSGDIKVKSYD
ncbi:MAG: biotin--[acetyl-CoA-carboxylase] ligase [Nitrospiraceae bacterium]|nr:biotin--[acetyl-CoA-carboxylase] ligase [Nitrospiraceae bacterium]